MLESSRTQRVPSSVLGRALRGWRPRLTAAGLALGLSGAQAAWAAPPVSVGERVPASNGQGMDTHLFRPAVDSKGFFTVNGTDVLGANDISFGLILDYGRNLMRTNPNRPDRGAKQLIANAFQGTFGFNYGIANRAVVGITVPVVLMEGNAANQLGPSARLYNSGQLDAQDLATIALHAKLRILRMQSAVGLAALVQAGIPVSSSPRDLAADPGVWYWPQLIVQKAFGSGRRFKIGIEGGYRGHTGKNPVFQLDLAGRPQLDEGVFQYGNLATFGGAFSYRALDSLDLVAETYGTYLLASNADSKQKRSQEVVGGIKLFVEKNSYLMMGGGSRYGAVSTGFEAADVRIFLGFVFEPSIGDRDGDGIADDVDKCPDQPEDRDGFQDSDGCPDFDNDNDGVPDDQDHCLNTPGPASNHGCPVAGSGDRDSTSTTSARTNPRTRTVFRTPTAVRTSTTTTTASPTRGTSARTRQKTRTAFRTPTVVRTSTTTTTASPTRGTSAPTSPRPTTAFRMRMAAPTRVGSSSRKTAL